MADVNVQVEPARDSRPPPVASAAESSTATGLRGVGQSPGHARVPSSADVVVRHPRQHLHAPSTASSAFESDDSSEETDLARRSARMAPRSVLPAPTNSSAAMVTRAQAGMAPGAIEQQLQAQQREQLMLLLQLEQQLQQQRSGQQSEPSGSIGHARPPLPEGMKSTAGISAVAGVGSLNSSTQQQLLLHEQYLRQWTGALPSAAADGIGPPGVPPRLLQEASLASSLGAQPVGASISRGETAVAGGSSSAGDWPGSQQGSKAGVQTADGPAGTLGEPSGYVHGPGTGADRTSRVQAGPPATDARHGPGGHLPAGSAGVGPSMEGRAAGTLVMPSQAAPPSLLMVPSLVASLAGAEAATPSAAGGSVVPPQSLDVGDIRGRPSPSRYEGGVGDQSDGEGDGMGKGADVGADAAGAQRPSTGGKARAAPSADQVVENLENIGALALFNQEEEEDEDGEEDDLPPPWYRRPAVLWFLGSVGLGLLLLLVGVILHNVFETSSDAFRWFYFFAGMPLLYYTLSYAVQRCFMLIEWWFFRESLFYLHSVQRKAVWLLFMLLLLPWFCAMFRWSWCSERPSFPRRCQQAAYLQATNILWNCLLCLMLFCLANLLKGVLAKLLTTHFYRTAHFKKLKKALEKEYVLQVLSRPRRLVMMERARAQAHAHAGSDGQLGAWFSMSMFHHGPVSGKRLTAGAAGGEAAGTGAAPAPAEVSGGAGNAAATADAEAPTAPVAVVGTGSTHPSKRFNAVTVAGDRAAPSMQAAGGPPMQAVQAAASPAEDRARAVGARAATDTAGLPMAVSGQPPRVSNPLYGPGRDAATMQADHMSVSVSVSSGASDGPQEGPAAAPAAHSAAQQAAAGEVPPTASRAPMPQLQLSGSGGAPFAAAGEAAATSGRPLSASLRGAATAQLNASLTGRRPGSRSPRLPTGRAGAGGLDASLGAGGLLRRQDSRASRVSRTSVLKGAAKAPAAGTARQGDEAVSQAMVEVVPPGNALTDKKGLHHMTEAELEAVRTAIVIKTQTALITKYADKNEEDMAKELGRVRRFARALYFNVLPPGAGRATLRLEDFTVFFEGGEAEAGEAAGEGAGGGGGGAAVAGSAAASAAPMAGGVGATAQENVGNIVHPTAVGAADGGAAGLPGAAATSAAERAHAVRRQQAEEAAKKAFAIFDTDGTGEVSRSDVREAVVNIYKERRNMARSLKDTETIVKSLEFGIGVVIHFLFAAVYLLIWGVDLLTGFSTFSATVLALTFVFGNSVKNMYESMLFLFVVHPYDVGDCVVIGTEMYRVKKISLLYTDMVRGNGERVYMPNTPLISQNITNWTRSKTKSESCRLVCDVGVAWEIREDIQAAMRAYAREHPGEFDGEPSCNFRELVDPLKVVLVCSWNYNFAPDDSGRLGPARNGMLFVVQQKARQQGLQHTAVTERVHE